jgi:hypothetical protein
MRKTPPESTDGKVSGSGNELFRLEALTWRTRIPRRSTSSPGRPDRKNISARGRRQQVCDSNGRSTAAAAAIATLATRSAIAAASSVKRSEIDLIESRDYPAVPPGPACIAIQSHTPTAASSTRCCHDRVVPDDHTLGLSEHNAEGSSPSATA